VALELLDLMAPDLADSKVCDNPGGAGLGWAVVVVVVEVVVEVMVLDLADSKVLVHLEIPGEWLERTPSCTSWLPT
jgi:hypothetical protein